MATIEELGNIKGPRGFSVVDSDVAGDGRLYMQLDSGQTIDAGAVRGPQGLPGVNAVSNDVATGTLFSTPTVTATQRGFLDYEARNTIALRRFRTALAARNFDPVDIFTIGHSFMEGVGATAITNRMVNQLIGNLRRRYQPAGVPGGLSYIPVRFDAALVGQFSDDPIGTVGAPTNSDAFGLGRRAQLLSPGAFSKLITYGMTGVDICYVKGPSTGTFTWQVDGGSATSVNTANATLADTGVTQIRGLNGSVNHTVQLFGTVGTTVFGGFMVYNGDETKGIRLWEGSRSAKDSSWFVDAAALNWSDRLPIINPSLVVLTILRNDWANGIPSATAKANIESLLGNIRAKVPADPSIVLCLEPDPTIIGPASSVEPWANYVDVAHAIAAGDPDVALFVMENSMNKAGSAGGVWAPDNIHQTNVGHQIWADQLTEFLVTA